MIKSYQHKISLNKQKLNHIENILYTEWCRVAEVLIHKHMNFFYMNSSISNSNDIYKNVNTFLTERYKDSINRQVVGLFKSKISNIKKRFVNIVMKSNLSDEIKKELCIVNKKNIFFLNEDNRFKTHQVEKEYIKLARWIFKNFFGKLPSCKNINMVLQDKIAVIQDPTKLKHKDFKYVIKLSSGLKDVTGKFFYLPINENKYSNSFDGKISTSCTLKFINKKLKCVILTKDVQNIEEPKLNNIVISFDIGLNILFALDNGECYGKHYMKTIKRLDNQLQEIIKDLKLKFGNSAKLTKHLIYTTLVKKMQDYSKNEINRILNKIFKKHKPYKIVIEDLDFRCSNIGSTNNRLLSKFGIGNIKAKLNQLMTDFKVIVKLDDPSYTSQTCNKCGYVDEKNRPKQNIFICKCCGKKINADVNGGRNIKDFNERFNGMIFKSKTDRSKKRTLLVKQFMDNKKVWVNDKRIIQVLIGNPYFMNYKMTLRERLVTLLS